MSYFVHHFFFILQKVKYRGVSEPKSLFCYSNDLSEVDVAVDLQNVCPNGITVAISCRKWRWVMGSTHYYYYGANKSCCTHSKGIKKQQDVISVCQENVFNMSSPKDGNISPKQHNDNQPRSSATKEKQTRLTNKKNRQPELKKAKQLNEEPPCAIHTHSARPLSTGAVCVLLIMANVWYDWENIKRNSIKPSNNCRADLRLSGHRRRRRCHRHPWAADIPIINTFILETSGFNFPFWQASHCWPTYRTWCSVGVGAILLHVIVALRRPELADNSVKRKIGVTNSLNGEAKKWKWASQQKECRPKENSNIIVVVHMHMVWMI